MAPVTMTSPPDTLESSTLFKEGQMTEAAVLKDLVTGSKRRLASD